MDLQVPQPEIFMPATRLLLAALGIILLAPSSPITGQDSILKENGELRWRRGNMHTHSLWSDGDHYPEMIAIWYRDHGYQFLVFTDHNTLLKNEKWVDVDKPKGGRPAFDALKTQFQGDWVVTRQSGNKLECRLKTFDEIYSKMAVPQEFLLIQGEEITDSYKTKPIHLCATNTAELLPPTGGDSVTDVMQRNIDASVARRERSGVKTLVHLNHPNFGYAITAEQLMLIVGETSSRSTTVIRQSITAAMNLMLRPNECGILSTLFDCPNLIFHSCTDLPQTMATITLKNNQPKQHNRDEAGSWC